MADVKKIITVSITRETNFPSSDSFGIGGIISEFTPGNLNTPMQGATGRYKRYVSLSVMEQDGWSEADSVYQAATAYFGENPNPGVFIVGLRKPTDNNWAEVLDAVSAENDEWYGFSVILSAAELATPTLFNAAIKEVADWTETKIKLFLFTTAQMGSIGELVLLSSGFFTSGKPGVLVNFQAVENGQFNISKDGASNVIVKDINMTASPVAGMWETGSVSGNLADFQSLTDGEMSVALDGAAAVDVTGIDTSVATNFAGVANLIQAAIQAVGGLSGVIAVYDSATNKILIISDSTGASSSLVIATVAIPAATDITGSSYLNGGTSEPGSVAGSVTNNDDVATALQAAIVAAGVTGVTVTYNSTDIRFVFTSATTGKTSGVEITALTDQSGEDLTAADYLNGGAVTWGKDAGATPGTDDIGTFLKSQYDRTGWIYHEKARDSDRIAIADVVWFEFAWMSRVFARFQPAEATWAYKIFSNNTSAKISDDNNRVVRSEINFAQDEFVRGNYGNTYTPTGGSDVTLDGRVCGGEYLDIMRGTDWLQAKLVEGAFKPLIDNPKIAFTDGGIGLEENAIRGVLAEAEVNLLDGAETTLIVPKEDDVSKADKAARIANGFEFSSVYQGAIQKVGITGTIGV